MEEISGISEEGGCKIYGETIFVSKISEMAIKTPGTSRADGVQ